MVELEKTSTKVNDFILLGGLFINKNIANLFTFFH